MSTGILDRSRVRSLYGVMGSATNAHILLRRTMKTTFGGVVAMGKVQYSNKCLFRFEFQDQTQQTTPAPR